MDTPEPPVIAMPRFVLRWAKPQETTIFAWDLKDAEQRALVLLQRNPGIKMLSLQPEGEAPPLAHTKFVDAIMQRIMKWGR